MKKTVTALLMLGVMTLVGCGQTGPLYLPAKPQPTNEQPQPVNDQ
ncbi:LPS translocon maturation chaperone LptM [Vibrio gelatinilyticus]